MRINVAPNNGVTSGVNYMPKSGYYASNRQITVLPPI